MTSNHHGRMSVGRRAGPGRRGRARRRRGAPAASRSRPRPRTASRGGARSGRRAGRDPLRPAAPHVPARPARLIALDDRAFGQRHPRPTHAAGAPAGRCRSAGTRRCRAVAEALDEPARERVVAGSGARRVRRGGHPAVRVGRDDHRHRRPDELEAELGARSWCSTAAARTTGPYSASTQLRVSARSLSGAGMRGIRPRFAACPSTWIATVNALPRTAPRPPPGPYRRRRRRWHAALVPPTASDGPVAIGLCSVHGPEGPAASEPHRRSTATLTPRPGRA